MSLIYAYIHWFFAVFVSTQTPDDWRSIMGRWPHKYLVADWGKYSSAQDNIMCRVCSFSGDPDPISPSLLSMYWRLKTDTDWNTRQWEIMIPPSEPYPISKLYTHCTNIRAVIQKGGPRAIYWLQFDDKRVNAFIVFKYGTIARPFSPFFVWLDVHPPLYP